MKNTILFSLSITALLLWGCGTEDARHFHYEWVFDVTDSLDFQEPGQVINAHLATWGMDREGICPHRITVTVTGIDQTSRQIQKTFELPEKLPPSKFRRTDRIRAQKKFLRDLELYVDLFTRPRPESRYSKMMRNLEPSLRRLSVSKADYRFLYVFGDGLQNNPETVSFYPFQSTPSRLIEPVVHDSLSAILLRDVPLPSLDGITVKLVGLSRHPDDGLAHYARKFWEMLFMGNGATSFEPITNF